ncbi:MAG: apolipoprotein N-acyltransferase [Deltaproteobacteria bacterium]|nr:apolipoprotein N-acyltransferase [Deltaproteobacteria bacterium]
MAGRLPRRFATLLPALAAPAATAVLLHLALGYPAGRFLGLAALLPLCWSLDHQRERLSPGRQGLLCGFIFAYLDLFWITHSISSFTSLPYLATLAIMALLAAYFSLYFGAFGWLLGRCPPRSLAAVIFLAGGWTVLELCRGTLVYGFPWNLLGGVLGHSGWGRSLLPLGGVYLLSFLVCYLNLAVFALWQQHRSWPATGRALGKFALLPAILLTLPLLAGPPPGLDQHRPLTVSLVQPNIPQAIKWDPAYREQNFARLEALSRRAAAAAPAGIPHLVVWPEAAIPDFLQDAPDFRRRLAALARKNHCYLLAGGPRYQRRDGKRPPAYFNSAFLYSPAGELAATYDKVKLVPFGEFIPGGRLLPFIGKLVPGADFSPGRRPAPLPFGATSMAVSICFEGIFPAYIAELGRQAGFLVNITNDSWFGKTAGPRQHLENTMLRAAENHRWLVRCANTGISAVVTPNGRREKSLPLNCKGILQTTIYPAREPTFYAAHPWLPPAAILLAAAGAWLCLRRRAKGFA